jgi:hypothetical protein
MKKFAEMEGKTEKEEENLWPFAVDPSTLHREDPMFLQVWTREMHLIQSRSMDHQQSYYILKHQQLRIFKHLCDCGTFFSNCNMNNLLP